MNKYQEAFDYIVKNSCPQRATCKKCEMRTICNSEAKYYVDVLQELIEKSTPKNANWIYDDEPLCPCCGEVLDTSEVLCPKCGQRLDWSDTGVV